MQANDTIHHRFCRIALEIRHLTPSKNVTEPRLLERPFAGVPAHVRQHRARLGETRRARRALVRPLAGVGLRVPQGVGLDPEAPGAVLATVRRVPGVRSHVSCKEADNAIPVFRLFFFKILADDLFSDLNYCLFVT